MLISVFKILVNNLFYKNFDIYFIKKVKILFIFLFFHKFFFSQIINQYPKSTIKHDLTDANIIAFGKSTLSLFLFLNLVTSLSLSLTQSHAANKSFLYFEN